MHDSILKSDLTTAYAARYVCDFLIAPNFTLKEYNIG